jgi:hypothetical protein
MPPFKLCYKIQSTVPAIIIFTKYDMLVTTAIGAGTSVVARLRDEDEIWQYGKDEASQIVEKLCIRPWRDVVGKVPLMVSSR